MTSYRKYDWPVLLEEFEQSGLTQAQFCLNKDINPKYFSQKRKASKAPKDSGFVKAQVQAPSGIILEVGRCKIRCANHLSLVAIADLVHHLA